MYMHIYRVSIPVYNFNAYPSNPALLINLNLSGRTAAYCGSGALG